MLSVRDAGRAIPDALVLRPEDRWKLKVYCSQITRHGGVADGIRASGTSGETLSPAAVRRWKPLYEQVCRALEIVGRSCHHA